MLANTFRLVITSLAATSVLSAYTQVGCVGSSFVDNNPTTKLYDQNGGDACAASCLAHPSKYPYAVYRSSCFVSSQTKNGCCACFDSTTLTPTSMSGQSANSAGNCENAGLYTALQTDSTFSNISPCYSTFSSDLSPSDTSNAKDCLTACASYLAVWLRPVSGGVFECRCSNSVDAGTGATTASSCGGASGFYHLTHSVSQASQGLSKRLRLAQIAKRNRKQALCPTGLTACTVSGSDSFECIDVQTELESCGGCRTTYFGGVTGATGVDCTALPDVALGGVTCSQGQCQVSACQEGSTLQDGRCVATSRRSH